MTKRKTEPTNNTPTELTIPKEDFSKKLTDRISIGEELHNKTIKTTQEFDKLKEDYSAWNDYNLEYLKHSFNKELNEYRKAYDNSTLYGGAIRRLTPQEELDRFKERISKKIRSLKKLTSKVDLLKQSTDYIEPVHHQSIKLDKSKVFIVHGHDDEAKTKTARFVENLGFEAIILHEKTSGSQTIIEKIEEYSKKVGFGIILYTPCDTGAKKTADPDLKPRARQNVVFEHGFLMGKIGRNNVCALVKGDIETPNDISGIVYTSMDSADAWRYTIADEMKRAGYNIDKNKL